MVRGAVGEFLGLVYRGDLFQRAALLDADRRLEQRCVSLKTYGDMPRWHLSGRWLFWLLPMPCSPMKLAGIIFPD